MSTRSTGVCFAHLSGNQELGACKTPKRLREAVDLVEKIIWRHGKCGYKPLLQKMCPSKVWVSGTLSGLSD